MPDFAGRTEKWKRFPSEVPNESPLPDDQTDVRMIVTHFMWGRSGFDGFVEFGIACRGFSVGLVKKPETLISADTQFALAA